MRKHNVLAALASFGLVTAMNAQVTQFNPSVTADGISYVLPKTSIVAEVSAMKIVFTPGEYAKYADRYLQLPNAKFESETTWAVTSINLYQVGTPDTLKRYTVKAKDKNLLPKVQLDENGIILSINRLSEVPEHNVEPAHSTNHRLDFRKYLNEEMLSATSSSKMAELIAQEILDIRDGKNTIRRGQAESMPKDGASLKIVLDQLDVQEEALTQMFVGYNDTVFCTETFSITPDQDLEKEVFFRFSKRLGFVDADDLSGEPYYINVKDQHVVPIPSEKDAAKRKIIGIVYNVPGMASVELYSGDKTYFSHDLPFAQFGTIDMLSPTLFKQDVTTRVTFNQATGGVSLLE